MDESCEHNRVRARIELTELQKRKGWTIEVVNGVRMKVLTHENLLGAIAGRPLVTYPLTRTTSQGKEISLFWKFVKWCRRGRL